MDPHIADIQTAVARAIVNPAAASPALDRVCGAAFRDLGCAADPGRQAFFRYMLRNVRLREQLRFLAEAAEVDALLAGGPVEAEHVLDAAGKEGEAGTLAEVLASLGGGHAAN
jgi:hypothetical protein